MPTVNELFSDAAIDHAVDLYQYSTGVVRRMLGLLNRADADLAAALAVAIERMPPQQFTVERLEKLLVAVRRLNLQAYARVEKELTQALKDFSEVEATYQSDLFERTIPDEIQVKYRVARITEHQVYAAALSRPFQGRLLKNWARQAEADRLDVLRNTVRLGFLEGQTNSQIVQRLRGTRANGYADGTFQRPRRELEAVVRAAVSHTAAMAREKMHAANDDIISALIWRSVLDTKTSEICIIRDKRKYTAKTHKPIGHQIPWLQGPGRSHWGCRAVDEPVTKSWRELGFDQDELSPSVQASMDGVVPDEVAYVDWLPKQPAYRQDQVLGPTRARLMRDGQIPVERFYSNKGDYLSIDELKVRNADAFRRAGL